MSGELDPAITREGRASVVATRYGQFELRPLQSWASPVGIATAVFVDSALRRRYSIAIGFEWAFDFVSSEILAEDNFKRQPFRPIKYIYKTLFIVLDSLSKGQREQGFDG